MKANIREILRSLDIAYTIFEHDNGKRMTKDEVRRLMEYGISREYSTTDEITLEDEGIVFGSPVRSDLKILEEVVGIESAKRKTRKTEYVTVRQIYSWYMVKNGYRNTVISRELGVDHSTVSHALKKANMFIEANDKYFIDIIKSFFRKKVIGYDKIKPVKIITRKVHETAQ